MLNQAQFNKKLTQGKSFANIWMVIGDSLTYAFTLKSIILAEIT